MTVQIEKQMPAVYAFASKASAKGQNRFKRLTWLALFLLVLAAGGGVVDRPWAGWASAAAFLASIVLTALASYEKSQRAWYDGRAAAESAKSIVFKYAVGGEPFPIGDPKADARLAMIAISMAMTT